MSIQTLTDVAILLLVGLAYFYWPAYLRKKAENLATKEDVEDITKKIESVKGAIGAQLYVHQVRYQNEFRILRKLSEKVVELRDAARSLRPSINYGDPDDPEEKMKRLNRYHVAMQDLYKTCEINKPFYPLEIYAGIKRLDKIGWEEAVDYTHGTFKSGKNFDSQYWDTAKANAQEIVKVADELMEEMRKRTKYWEEFKT